MPQGGKLRVAVGLVNAPADIGLPPDRLCAVLEVSDTGTGIDPETLERVFEPFFTTKDIGRGSGLGLSQVFGFAAQSGGFAKLESSPGQGTTVCLCLLALGD
jgi:signal transduction histidine kinase